MTWMSPARFRRTSTPPKPVPTWKTRPNQATCSDGQSQRAQTIDGDQRSVPRSPQTPCCGREYTNRPLPTLLVHPDATSANRVACAQGDPDELSGHYPRR